MQGARTLGRAQQIYFLFFIFVLLRDLRGCNEAQRSIWTFYEIVKLDIYLLMSYKLCDFSCVGSLHLRNLYRHWWRGKFVYHSLINYRERSLWQTF